MSGNAGLEPLRVPAVKPIAFLTVFIILFKFINQFGVVSFL